MVIGLILTSFSYVVGLKMNWIEGINWLEAFCVFTSYACTYLCVVQSRKNYIFGIISVASLVVLFYQAGLYSSMVLNLYLFPTLVWGWFRWGKDECTRPVKWVELKWWPAYIGITAITWYILTALAEYMSATLPATDSFILAFSILAQFLLDQKKIETWAVWITVNVVAIYTYWEAGLVIVALQYVLFLVNAFLGFAMWKRSMKVEA